LPTRKKENRKANPHLAHLVFCRRTKPKEKTKRAKFAKRTKEKHNDKEQRHIFKGACKRT
jgi:hypothetical protein